MLPKLLVLLAAQSSPLLLKSRNSINPKGSSPRASANPAAMKQKTAVAAAVAVVVTVAADTVAAVVAVADTAAVAVAVTIALHARCMTQFAPHAA